MITKEQFIKFISEYQNFEQAIDRIDKAISGKKWSLCLFECDWYNSVGILLDTFLNSHFNNTGCDLITWWLFEDVDKVIFQKVDSDLFNGESEIKYNVENLEDLWNYLIKYKDEYFLK